MIESKHVIINHLNRWVESYDIVKEWDSDGHIIRQEVVKYRREWTYSRLQPRSHEGKISAPAGVRPPTRA